MDTKTIRLFDANDNLVSNFDEEVEKVLISIHGYDYYDTDEELVNTNLIPVSNVIDSDKIDNEELEKTMEYVDLITEDAKAVKIVDKKSNKVSVKDFIPVLFFMLIFGIIIAAGYYFLNTIDLMSLIS
ncbi:MAG: hypothetical protein J5982_00145 [Bacilli bacterium]|nr:hypothetical protein [Bacilli bacterium]